MVEYDDPCISPNLIVLQGNRMLAVPDILETLVAEYEGDESE